MAKRRLLQWMRDRLNSHAEIVVIPAKAKKLLVSAYSKAEPLVVGIVQKRYPQRDMDVLLKYDCARRHAKIKMQFPSGVVTEFEFDEEHGGAYVPGGRCNHVFLADAATAAAVDKWEVARGEYKEERKRRLAAYSALIAGSSYVEDIIAAWPEAGNILPAGSPLIPLGPEQIALVEADQKERAA